MKFNFTQIYAVDDADPKPIQIDQRFPVITIVVETLNISSPPENLDDYDFDENGESDATTGVTEGVITLKFSPKGSFRKFSTEGNVITLTDTLINFLTLGVQVDKIFPSITTPVVGGGCTHLAITVSGDK